jgi:hypothetical protein
MIKTGQAEELSRIGLHCIAAMTKSQIETLLEAGVLQNELCDAVGWRALRAVAESSACRTSTGFARPRAGAGCTIVQKSEIAI